eukprot:gene192-523_t
MGGHSPMGSESSFRSMSQSGRGLPPPPPPMAPSRSGSIEMSQALSRTGSERDFPMASPGRPLRSPTPPSAPRSPRSPRSMGTTSAMMPPPPGPPPRDMNSTGGSAGMNMDLDMNIANMKFSDGGSIKDLITQAAKQAAVGAPPPPPPPGQPGASGLPNVPMPSNSRSRSRSASPAPSARSSGSQARPKELLEKIKNSKK